MFLLVRLEVFNATLPDGCFKEYSIFYAFFPYTGDSLNALFYLSL